MFITPPSKQELLNRIEKLYNLVNANDNNWDAVFIVDKVNQYYFTGTMQDGIFILKRDGAYAYFARRSYERAKIESPLDNIHPMAGYRDAANIAGADFPRVYIETEVMTCGIMQRLRKYFKIGEMLSADRIIFRLRAVKSAYELSNMEESGRQHGILFEKIIPSLMREGMNEAELTAEIYCEAVKQGFHGVSRFAMFQTEVGMGQLGFGENSLCATNFDGPGGMRGQYPAVPGIGDRTRLLKKGDLVFIDIGYGVNGYHTDRTQIYMFGEEPCECVMKYHRECMEIQKKAAAMLKTGNIPGKIYSDIMGGLEADFAVNFMGFGERKAKFLGHGVGLNIDEFPVITRGFDEPLEENMTIALEPKRGIEKIGLVGVEDTYIVTKDGGRCITGGEKDIIVV